MDWTNDAYVTSVPLGDSHGAEEWKAAIERNEVEWWLFDVRHWRCVDASDPEAAPADGDGFRGRPDVWFAPVSELARVIAAQAWKSRTGLIYTDTLADAAGVIGVP